MIRQLNSMPKFHEFLVLIVLGLCPAFGLASDTNEHIQNLIKELPETSPLRRDLLAGARGDGVHRPWMGPMREHGVRRATVWISIKYNRHGQPEKLRIHQVRYCEMYDGGVSINDAVRLRDIRSSGLEKQLTDSALQKAKEGAWVDVPRPKPRPFIGGTKVDFLDDEWLPIGRTPLLCAGQYCLD